MRKLFLGAVFLISGFQLSASQLVDLVKSVHSVVGPICRPAVDSLAPGFAALGYTEPHSAATCCLLSCTYVSCFIGLTCLEHHCTKEPKRERVQEEQSKKDD